MNGLHNTSTDSVFAFSPLAPSGEADIANASQKPNANPEKDNGTQTAGKDIGSTALDFKNFLQHIDGDAIEGSDITATNKIATQEVIMPNNFPTDFITGGIKPSIFQATPEAELEAEFTPQQVAVEENLQGNPKYSPAENIARADILLPTPSQIPANIVPSLANSEAQDILALQITEPSKHSTGTPLTAIDVKIVREQVALSPDMATIESNPRINPQDTKSETRNQQVNVPTIAGTPSPDTQTGQYGSQNQNSGQDKNTPPPLPQSVSVNEAPTIAATITPDTSQNFIARAPEIASITSVAQIGSTPALQSNVQTNHMAVQQVADAIIRLTEKSGDIVVRLDPAELGRVNINFTFDKGNAVHAQVIAETASTAAILRERSDILNLQLKQAGFENINLSFDTNSDSADESGFGSQFSERHPSQQADNQNTPIFDIVDSDKNAISTQPTTVPKSRNQYNGIIDMKL